MKKQKGQGFTKNRLETWEIQRKKGLVTVKRASSIHNTHYFKCLAWALRIIDRLIA